MRPLAWLVGLLIAGAVPVPTGEAQPLKYLGRQAEAPTGWIEFGRETYYEIGAGTEIPSWGTVKEVRDDRIVVERVRTDAEKRGMEKRGALVHDVLEIHLLREDLRLTPSAPSSEPHAARPR